MGEEEQEKDPQPGDVVQLKSGGPKMTVVGETNFMVECNWFCKQGLLHAGVFKRAALER